jgi:hypothetical protein
MKKALKQAIFHRKNTRIHRKNVRITGFDPLISPREDPLFPSARQRLSSKNDASFEASETKLETPLPPVTFVSP